jgi:hypothetical protein
MSESWETSGSRTEQEARETAGELKEEARRLAEEAKHRGQALFEGQRLAAADEIGGMVDALRKTAHDLEGEQRRSTANFAYRAAESLDRLAGTLRNRDLRSLIGQGEAYARRHPGMFFGGSVITGLLLARFLKSSSERAGYGASGYRRAESGYLT